MTPQRMVECLDILGMSALALATKCNRHRNTGVVWRSGKVRIPDDVAAWLERAVRWHQANPPPRYDRQEAGA